MAANNEILHAANLLIHSNIFTYQLTRHGSVDLWLGATYLMTGCLIDNGRFNLGLGREVIGQKIFGFIEKILDSRYIEHCLAILFPVFLEAQKNNNQGDHATPPGRHHYPKSSHGSHDKLWHK